MENPRYLYGAAVQGIQSFLFQTNELKDIVGASELVETICTSLFEKLLGSDFCEECAIVMAAGNIKYDFSDIKTCSDAVLKFPKAVMDTAPGIIVSQAVVKYGNFNGSIYKDFESAVKELEKRLSIQRNKPVRSHTLGCIGMLRSRKTGLPAIGYQPDEALKKTSAQKTLPKPAIEYKLDEAIDAGTKKKRENPSKKENGYVSLFEKMFGEIPAENITTALDNITGRNNWIAIVHADGNGLGQVIRHIGSDAADLKIFSSCLDKATRYAAQNAYKRLLQEKENTELAACISYIPHPDGQQSNRTADHQHTPIPMRPIVLGGDDLTLVCRADWALDFTRFFLEEFEYATGRERNCGSTPGITPNEKTEQERVKNTLKQLLQKKNIFKDGSFHLTACAGIAYIKYTYPFHFGYDLAGALCSEAKKETKALSKGRENLPPSCLMFHKVQSSFIEEFKSIEEKELTAAHGVSFKFGPYYLQEPTEIKDTQTADKPWTIATLRTNLELLRNSEKGQAVKNQLREWTNLLIHNPELAKLKLSRLKTMLQEEEELQNLIEKLQRFSEEKCIPVYDLLSLYSVQYQETNKK